MVEKIQTKQGRVWIEREVTPQMAAELLGKLHPGQRRLRKQHASAIAKDMLAGRFVWTADPIRVDADGLLIDGQHRLAACVESDVPMANVVFAKVFDPNTIKYIDTTSAGRSVSDIRKVSGKETVSLAVISAVVLEFCDFDRSQVKQLTKVDRSELVDECELTGEAKGLYAAGRVVGLTAAPLAAALRCMRSNRAMARRFFHAAFSNSAVVEGQAEVCTQARLLADTLIGMMQARLGQARDRKSGSDEERVVVYKCIRAYNAWRRGEVMAKLQRPPMTPEGFEIPKPLK